MKAVTCSAVTALVLGCAGSGTQNSAIGMTEVNVIETADRTTIIGRDDQGREIARLDLVHGRFTLSPEFDDGPTRQVFGRKLDVRALDQSMRWETEGFTPTLALPPHPADQWALGAFLEDDRVERALRSWGIAFSPAPDAGDFICDLDGTHAFECSGQATCEPLFMNPAFPPPTTCGGTSIPTEAWRVHQRANAGYHLDRRDPNQVAFDQSVIAQCCPPTAVNNFFFFAKKTCPDRPDCSVSNPCMTTCGPVTRPNACAGCLMYLMPTNAKCTMLIESANRKDKLAPGGPAKVVNVCARYAWRCGDSVCDIDEDCANCDEDCGCHDDQLCVPDGDGASCRDEGDGDGDSQ